MHGVKAKNKNKKLGHKFDFCGLRPDRQGHMYSYGVESQGHKSNFRGLSPNVQGY